jgi:hypothetical protein
VLLPPLASTVAELRQMTRILHRAIREVTEG